MATSDIHAILAENSVFGVLASDVVSRSRIALDEPFTVAGLTITAFAVPGKVALFKEGAIEVQDEGSQLVAAALAGAPLDGPDRLWVDLCAGPGGKAALLDVLAGERGARLVALEAQHRRSRLQALHDGRHAAVRSVRQGAREEAGQATAQPAP